MIAVRSDLVGGRKYPVPSSDTIISSLEFRFMIDRALLAHRLGRNDVERVFSHAAQGLLEAALPEIATSFSKAASRQGQGDVIAAGMIPHLTPRAAAAVCVVLMIRGARSPVIKALKDAFGAQPEFDATIVMLCRRLFEPVITTSSNVIATSSLGPFTPIETSAPYRS